MKVLAIEPYGARSHVAFLEGLAEASRHDWQLEVWPARYWKWRMGTAALGARDLVAAGDHDVLFVSDFLNLAALRAILPPGRRDVPVVMYFHENQLTYPLRKGERRDIHHGLTNVHGALAADHVLFNSAFHRRAFVAATDALLRRAPDLDLGWVRGAIDQRSTVLPIGTDIEVGEGRSLAEGEDLVIAWNHRWEYDKAPEVLVQVVAELESRGLGFQLVLLGERFRERPAALGQLESRFAHRIAFSGFADSRAEYLAWLDRSHVLFSAARHEFFGLSTLEGLRRGLLPVLPDDLAYPELLPAELRRAPHLYPRSAEDPGVQAAADALLATADLLRGQRAPTFAASTEPFHWSLLGPRYDAVLESL
ncbi:MAG: DUF3524 domain-containing protein [Planctomycetota bacterium]|nr:DUF3524 domain-containing protein [Planctomycetota bacterium]